MGVKNGVYIQCEYCGNEIYRTQYQYNKRKHHFCSNECRAKMSTRLSRDDRICEHCGRSFVTKRSDPKRFCSVKCQNDWQRGNVGFKNPRFMGASVRCDNCGEQVLVGKYKLDHTPHHFCSVACRQEWYATVWSQRSEWKEESRKRAVEILQTGAPSTMTRPQSRTNQMLEDMGIAYVNEYPCRYYSIDNYLPEYGLAIEVMGDYWHASPLLDDRKLSRQQMTVISRDSAKRDYIRNECGIELLYLWESDVMRRSDVCEMLILRYISSGGLLQNYHSFNYAENNVGMLELNGELIIPHQERLAGDPHSPNLPNDITKNP